MPDVAVILENSEIDSEELESLIGNLIDDTVEIVVTDPGYLRVLNRRFRHIDRATDVLTFDLARNPTEVPEGTIFVDGRLFPPMESLLERIFHGYLHLNGYSHENDEDACNMSSKVDILVAEALRNEAEI